MVGPCDEADFDNPTGRPIYPDLPADAYHFVFDFGCGCGRLARQLIQQTPRPTRYVGIDPHRGHIGWAATNLSVPGFEFHHHDVYSPGYASQNRLRLADRFPVENACVSLLIAHSVFTHLTRDQTGYYLAEVARVLAVDGVAFTSWFFFDNDSTPFFADGPHALYADEKDFSAAVLYDRRWFVRAIEQAGLTIDRTRPPAVPGHQWEVWLSRRDERSVDQFPLDEDGAEFVCGATRKAMARRPDDRELLDAVRTGSRQGQERPVPAATPVEPPLPSILAALAAARHEAAQWRQRAIVWRATRRAASWVGWRY